MQISTQKLRDLVDEALRQDALQWQQEELDFVARQQKHHDEWLEKFGQQWVAAATTITEKIGRGEPITTDDLPKDRDKYGYRDVVLFSSLRPESRHEKDYVKGTAVYKQPRDLVQFRAFLETVEGDTISTSALKDHGFANLQNRVIAYIHEATVR
jgi:hypothetical protein